MEEGGDPVPGCRVILCVDSQELESDRLSEHMDVIQSYCGFLLTWLGLKEEQKLLCSCFRSAVGFSRRLVCNCSLPLVDMDVLRNVDSVSEGR